MADNINISSRTNVLILINNCLLLPGASESHCPQRLSSLPGLELEKEAHVSWQEQPGRPPTSPHLHFLIPSYSIVANSGLANSPAGSLGVYANPLSGLRVRCQPSLSPPDPASFRQDSSILLHKYILMELTLIDLRNIALNSGEF